MEPPQLRRWRDVRGAAAGTTTAHSRTGSGACLAGASCRAAGAGVRRRTGPFPLLPVGLDLPGGHVRFDDDTLAVHADLQRLACLEAAVALALFIPEGERRAFRTMVAELRQRDQLLEWQARMQPWRGAPFDAALTTRVVRGSHGQITSIRWVIQNLTARKQGEEQPRTRNLDFEQRIDEFIGQSGDRPPANDDRPTVNNP